MSETLYRSFIPDLEVRTAGEGRTIIGRAVPYGVPQRVEPHLVEQFARGAFDKQAKAAHRVHFARGHLSQNGTHIGRVQTLREESDGLYFEARVSPTVAGDETLALVKDGALDEVSIGFRPQHDRNLPGGIVERVTAHLTEIAMVVDGAYRQNAVVMAVRSGICPTCGHGASRLDEARAVLDGIPTLLPLI